MNINAHKKAIKESLELINDSIQAGVERRQRTIGFHCSAAAVDILETFLHEKNLIDPGTTIKHDFFASLRKANEKIEIDFPNKDSIMEALVEIEAKRNLLCYGKPQSREAIEEYLLLFNKLRKIFDEMGVEYE